MIELQLTEKQIDFIIERLDEAQTWLDYKPAMEAIDLMIILKDVKERAK
jgi:hypothetical protein